MNITVLLIKNGFFFLCCKIMSLFVFDKEGAVALSAAPNKKKTTGQPAKKVVRLLLS